MVDDDSGSSRSDWLKLGAIAAAVGWYTGVEIPEWSLLAASGAVIVGIAAAFATGKIEALLPDPPKKHLVQINSNGDPLAYWRISPDAWNDLEIKWGPLYPHTDSGEDVFECYAYNEATHTAVGTWRRSIPGSDLVGNFDADDVLDVIGEYRSDLEPEARRGREIRQALPRVLRRLDYQRMEAQNRALDPTMGPETGGPSIDDVIVEELPEELRPGRLQTGDLRDLLESDATDVSDDEWLADGMDLVVGDGDALEPAPELANDGGYQHE
jgi:hypothetical protein